MTHIIDAIKSLRYITNKIIYTGTCTYCKQFFYTAYPNTYNCSIVCSRYGKGERKIINCMFCKKPTYRARWEQKSRKQFFCSRDCKYKGQRFVSSPNWKGGSIIDKYGYRRILINGRYEREHRIKMAHHLGRKLRPFENVHHINGIRSDNKISNLELWFKRQPCGQRVYDVLKFVAKYYSPEIKKLLHS